MTVLNEKYRPKEFEEVINLPPQLPSLLGRDMPNLLLVGKPGTGKTTTGRIIIKKLDAISLELNASDERGIQTIRDKVKAFAAAGSEGIRIVFLDEADGLTADAQQSLRAIMEKYHINCKFILTANYKNKIIEPLKSRCACYEFVQPKKEQIMQRLVDILLEEKVDYENSALIKILDRCYPDIRKTINEVQMSTIDGKLNEKTLTKSTELFSIIYQLIKERKFKEIRREVIENNVDFQELYHYLYNKILEDDYYKVEQKKKAVLVIAERLYRNGYIADPEINFSACLVDLWNL